MKRVAAVPVFCALALVWLATGCPPTAEAVGARAAGSAEPSWRPLPPSPLARTEVAAAAVGPFVYVVGGFGDAALPSRAVARYDTRSNRWELKADLPLTLNHAVAVSHGGDLYVLGGYTGAPFSLGIPTIGVADASAGFFRYDPDADSWSSMPPAPTARGAAAAAVIGDRLYAAGGADSGRALRTLEIFDFTTKTWSRGPDMPHASEHVAGAQAAGAFYVLGGRLAYGQQNLRFTQRYLPEQGRWEVGPDMVRGHAGFAAVTVCGDIVAFGGEQPGEGASGTIAEVERYDTELGAWTLLPAMPTPRHGLGGAAVGNRLFAAEGGPITFASVSNVLEALRVDCGKGAQGPPRQPSMRVSVRPTTVTAGRRTRLRVRVSSAAASCRGGVRAALDGRGRLTDRRGRTDIHVRLRAGRHLVTATKPGCRKATAAVRAVRSRRPPPRFTG